MRCLLVICLMACTLTTFAADPAAVRIPNKSDAKTQGGRTAAAKQRLREGAKLTDVHGRFELTGERVAFYPADGSDTLPVLENLALERTAQILQDSRGKQEWIVSGVITEFRGSNYLLLTKAIVRSTE